MRLPLRSPPCALALAAALLGAGAARAGEPPRSSSLGWVSATNHAFSPSSVRNFCGEMLSAT